MVRRENALAVDADKLVADVDAIMSRRRQSEENWTDTIVDIVEVFAQYRATSEK